MELDLFNTLKTAHLQNLTFYDTSYILIAKKPRSNFCDYDEKLRKIANKHVETMTYKESERKLTANGES